VLTNPVIVMDIAVAHTISIVRPLMGSESFPLVISIRVLLLFNVYDVV
jgi:hypothetical protein